MTLDFDRSTFARADGEHLGGNLGRSEVLTLGVPEVDAQLDGLPRGALHEVVPAGAGQLTTATGFGLGLALRAAGPRPVAWASHDLLDSESGRLDGSGLAAFGAKPERVLVARLRRTEDVLRAGLEAARSPGLGAVLVEVRGDARAADFTATRRLALAAKASGVTVILVRGAAHGGSTAATTRWRVGLAPSVPLEGQAPGHPAFRVTLTRHRGGIPERTWRMEWDRDRRSFAKVAPLPGAVVSAPADRPSQGATWSGRPAPEARRAG